MGEGSEGGCGANGFQLVYTDADDGVVKTSPAGATNSSNSTSTGQLSGSVVMNAKFGTTPQYQFGYTSSGTTAMVYSLHIRVEALN